MEAPQWKILKVDHVKFADYNPAKRTEDAKVRGLADSMSKIGLSSRVYHTARRICRYCDDETPETTKAVLKWLLEFAVIGQVMKAMEAGESPRLILDAVKRMKPIKMRLTVES